MDLELLLLFGDDAVVGTYFMEKYLGIIATMVIVACIVLIIVFRQEINANFGRTIWTHMLAHRML